MQFTKQKIQLYTSILTGFFFLLNTTQLQAQDYRPVSWGLKAGINAADMYGDDVGGTSAISGFSGGAWLNFRMADYFSLQPEVLFSSKGSDVNMSLMRETGTTEYRFGYLEIPVLTKLHVPTGSNLEPNLYAGPELGFILYGDANDIDIDDQMTDTEFGLVFGGGLDLNVAQSSADFIQTIGLDLRYTLGLTDAFDVTGDPDAKNGAFTAAISLGF